MGFLLRAIRLSGSIPLTPQQVGTVSFDHFEEARVLDVPERLAGLVRDEETEVGQQLAEPSASARIFSTRR